MGVWMIKGMAVSLGMTLLLELAFSAVVCLVYLKFFDGKREDKLKGKKTKENPCSASAVVQRYRKEICLVILVNVLTNPIVVFTVYMMHIYLPDAVRPVTAVMEVLAVVTEALIYQKCSRNIRHPWLYSLFANAFSYGVGLFL